MEWFTIAAVSVCTGIFASLGLGGGLLLIVWLTVFAHMPQLQAQGINLVFFIPIAALSLIFHSKNKLVQWKKMIPMMLSGVAAVVVLSIAANAIDNTRLKKIFAVFVIACGIFQLFTAKDRAEGEGKQLEGRSKS